jgi:hypothetical protein
MQIKLIWNRHRHCRNYSSFAFSFHFLLRKLLEVLQVLMESNLTRR